MRASPGKGPSLFWICCEIRNVLRRKCLAATFARGAKALFFRDVAVHVEERVYEATFGVIEGDAPCLVGASELLDELS